MTVTVRTPPPSAQSSDSLAAAAGRARRPTLDDARWLEGAVLVALAVWSMLLFVAMALYAASRHLVFLGTDGRSPLDLLQYLAWARDYSHHWLAGNLLALGPADRVFLDPMWLASGLLLRLGASLTLALLAWKPVAVLALFFAVRAYVERHLPAGRARPLGLLLALFAFTPGVGLIQLTAGAGARSQVGLLSTDLFVGNYLWGYLPTAIAVALMPICLLGVERACQAADGRERVRALLAAALAGLLAGWLHPWQGETLLLILFGAWLLGPRKGGWALVAPMPAILAPLLYYLVLSRTAAGWRLAETGTGGLGVFSPLVLAAGLVPVLLPALPGCLAVRSGGIGERLLLLWPIASLAVYFLPGSWRLHALDGLTVPLAVLAIRGWPVWRRWLPARFGSGANVAAWLAIVVFVAPDGLLAVRSVRDIRSPTAAAAFVRPDELRALRFVASLPAREGVAAPVPIAATVPALTGHPTWIGHPSWTPDYAARAILAYQLFFGSPSPASARRMILRTGAWILLAPCGARASLAAAAQPLGFTMRRFGCATVYVR
jgi:hypothetical protein